MTLRGSIACCLLGALPACATTTAQRLPAPGTLVIHAEGAVGAELGAHRAPVVRGSADLGFEDRSCCGAALYVARTTREDKDSSKARVREIVDGGIEANLVIPALQNRLRLRGRFGKAGTPPKPPDLGRSGFSTSATGFFRLWDVNAPPVNDATGNVDLLIGYSAWSLGGERTTAGTEEPGVSGHDVLIGVRIGADYGVDFD